VGLELFYSLFLSSALGIQLQSCRFVDYETKDDNWIYPFFHFPFNKERIPV